MTRARATVADVVAVLVLMLLVLSVLDDSFSGRSHLVTGLVPVVVLIVAALLTRGLHEGVWWYALAVVLLFAPLGALAAFHRPGPYVLPTLETMNRVLGEVAGAPSALVGTLPPVEPSGQVMLVPFLIGFLGAAPTAWLALATSRTLAPALPLVLALAATIPLGVLVPSLLVPRGIVFAIVVVVWAALRARRREAILGRARGSVAAGVVAVATVTLVSSLTSLLVPDDNEVDRVLFRGEGSSALVAGAADTTTPSATGHRELLRATGVPEGQRLRFAALDLYDGEAWVPAEESPGTDGYGTFKRVGHVVSALHPGSPVDVRIQVRRGYSSDWLPMLGELTRLDVDYTDGRTQLDQVRYNQATSSAFVVGGVDPRDHYAFTSVLTDPSFRADDAVRTPTDDQRQPAGAFLDPYLAPFDRDDLLPLQRTLLLARYLRLNGTVRLTGSSSQAPVDLGLRLLGSREMVGTPFQYSAVMALGASRLGVPARVVTGADPGRGGIVEVDDVTSWVELQLADGTWRPLQPERYVGVHQVADGGDSEEAAAAGAWVKKWLEDDDKEEFRIPKGTKFEFPEGAEFEIEEPRDVGSIVVRSLAAVAAALLLPLLLASMLKVVRRQRRRRTTSWSGLYVNGWQEVLDAARDRGTPVPEGWSRLAQATAIGAGAALARRADAAVFAPGPGADASAGRAFWDDCLVLRRELLREADRRHRWWAVFNPASLLTGWARRRAADSVAKVEVRHEDRCAGSEQPARA